MKTSILFSFLAIVFASIRSSDLPHDHTCGTANTNIKVNFKTIYRKTNHFSNLQQSTWEPIRIYIDYTHLQTFRHSFSHDVITNLKFVFENTKTLFESLIMVKREIEP